MRGQTGGILTLFVALLVFGGFGFLLYNNTQNDAPLQVIVPTQIDPTEEENPWQDIFREGFGSNTTALPTIAIPDQQFTAPTIIPRDDITPTPFEAAALLSDELFTLQPVSVGVTPTRVPPTPVTSFNATDAPQVQAVAQQPTIPWQPPALQPPLNRDSLGRDHYYFIRPIDSDGYNFGVPYYPYGSRGQQLENPLRIHHGIDMPNAVGTTVRAGGAGRVCFASTLENATFQGSQSYGNVVVIEHDFGWDGNVLYTLYAHLQSPLVQAGDYVQTGQALALSGNSGQTTGAHLHFEVRIGQTDEVCGSRYGNSYNPVLWMVPYENHGVIAGRLIDENGDLLDNYTVTLRHWATGLVQATTPTYIYDDTADQVNEDPNWEENFAFGDVPAGRYEVVATYNGIRLSQVIDVAEGLTSFVELKPGVFPTPQIIEPTQTP